MWFRILSVSLAFSAAGIHAQTICPPFLPTLPISTSLRNSTYISDAVANITSRIESLMGDFLSLDDSFSVDFYSVRDAQPLFTYHHSAPDLANATEGVQRVDSNTIYRTGSISKVFTVYTYLQNVGDSTWNQPITRYVPQLAAVANATEDSDVDVVKWEDVTVGALASHLAGIARDAALSPMNDAQLTFLGLPAVPSVNGSFCGGNQLIQFPCDRESYFLNLLPRHPVVAPFQSPVYSNMAFTLLAYALENITETSFAELVNSTIADLDLNSTYYGAAPTGSAVVPPGMPMYSSNLTVINPAGGFYSTLNDMRRFGVSILNSTLLPAALTRRWLKPHSFTPDTYRTVGAPWEIVPFPPNNRFPTQIYSKSGNVGAYSSMMGLIPDYGVGFTVLSAGPSPQTPRYLSDLVTSTFLPAVKEAAAEQTERLYAGVYTDESSNSTVELSMREDPVIGPIVRIDNWTFNGTSMAQFLSSILGLSSSSGPLELNLFPTGLKSVAENGDELISWRGTVGVLPGNVTVSSFEAPLSGPFTAGCDAWAGLDPYTYGYTAFDEALFRASPQNGSVLAVEMRVLQQAFLEKTGSGVNAQSKRKRDATRRVQMVKRW